MRVMLAMIVWIGSLAVDAHGQAFCAMRDPVSGIFKTFSEAHGYSSITRTVRPDLRMRIAERLPFTLHFNELGRHTVYLPLQDETPIGVLHVRSERGRYGLVEIGWALDLGTDVRTVYFQRCRDSDAKAAMERLRPKLEGASLSDLLELHAQATDPSERMVLESGIKTIVVTKDAWGDALQPWQAKQIAASQFGAGATVQPMTIDLSTLDPEYRLHTDAAAAWSVSDAQGDPAGTIVRLDWTLFTHPLELWWVIDDQRRMQALVRSTGKSDKWCVMLFDMLEGKGVGELEACATASGVVASEVIQATTPPTP